MRSLDNANSNLERIIDLSESGVEGLSLEQLRLRMSMIRLRCEEMLKNIDAVRETMELQQNTIKVLIERVKENGR